MITKRARVGVTEKEDLALQVLRSRGNEGKEGAL
jgi:hypothetical protein